MQLGYQGTDFHHNGVQEIQNSINFDPVYRKESSRTLYGEAKDSYGHGFKRKSVDSNSSLFTELLINTNKKINSIKI